jgi:hypothetical protein
VRVQLLEIYNESLRDLLLPEAQARAGAPPLAIQSTQRSGSNVPDAIQLPVSTAEEVLRVMALGARNRATAETRMNDRSSRSHQGERAPPGGVAAQRGGTVPIVLLWYGMVCSVLFCLALL